MIKSSFYASFYLLTTQKDSSLKVPDKTLTKRLTLSQHKSKIIYFLTGHFKFRYIYWFLFQINCPMDN